MSHKSCFVALAGLVVLLSACARSLATPFVNLDFEQSTVQPSDGIVVSASAAFPGWTAQIGGVTQDFVYHDAAGAGEPVVALYDHEVPSSYLLLQGRYMAYLEPGTPNAITSLGQTGDIPLGTRSITLLCDGGAGPPVVTLNGTVIPMIYLSGIPFNREIDTYGGDVSAFAGNTVQFLLGSGSHQDPTQGRRVVDDVRFSTAPLPEATSGAVLTVPIYSLLCRRMRRRSRQNNSSKGRSLAHVHQPKGEGLLH